MQWARSPARTETWLLPVARTELQKARKAQSAARVEADAGAREELDADYVEYREDRADRVGEALVGVSGRSADLSAGGGEFTS